MIYKILPDYRYSEFAINGSDIRKKLGDDETFHMHGSPSSYTDKWKPVKIDFDEKTKIPDISTRQGRLFLTTKAYEVLKSEISSNGEALPIYFDDQDGYLFNILSFAEDFDAVDKEKSMYDVYTAKCFITFYESKITHLNLLRTEVDEHYGVFCSEKIKQLIEQHNLKGVVFSEDLGAMVPPDDSIQKETHH